MKTVRISGIICKRIRRRLSIALCGFGAGVFVTQAAVCAASWHPLHGLVAALALCYAALEFHSALKAARL